MRVRPEVEITEREINQQRDCRQNQPDQSRCCRRANRTNQRISERRQREPNIQTGAARANCELMSSEMKRSIGKLMAEETKSFVNISGQRRMPISQRERRTHDCHYDCQRNERKKTPNAESERRVGLPDCS